MKAIDPAIKALAIELDVIARIPRPPRDPYLVQFALELAAAMPPPPPQPPPPALDSHVVGAAAAELEKRTGKRMSDRMRADMLRAFTRERELGLM